MIRDLKAPRWVATVDEQDKFVIEVAIDDVAELEKLKDNVAHGSVAQLINENGLTVYIFNALINPYKISSRTFICCNIN